MVILVSMSLSLIIIMILVNRIIKDNVKNYESGLTIGYYCKGINENYNLYYNENKPINEPLEKELVIKLFKDLQVPVKSFEENHIIIPWEAVIRWKYDMFIEPHFTGKSVKTVIIFKIEKMPLELVKNFNHDMDGLHLAFKKYSKDKEEDSYKMPKSVIIMLVIFLIYLILCFSII